MENIAVTSVVESLPSRMRPLFVEVIGVHAPDLLVILRSSEEPTQEQREAVEDILANEFGNCVGEDSEPTERGKEIDGMLGAFLIRWPIRPNDRA
jgi:hypothetical protein